jgi:hypothetical protein
MNSKYTIVRINGANFYMHRLMWEMFNGSIPVGHVVHHKDGNVRNNNIDNLELMTRAEHCAHHKDDTGDSATKSRASKSRRMQAYKCATCSIDFMSIANASAARRFCSTKCKNDARRTA